MRTKKLYCELKEIEIYLHFITLKTLYHKKSHKKHILFELIIILLVLHKSRDGI